MPGSSLIFPDNVARPFFPFQHRAHRERKPSASLSRSSPLPAARKTMVPYAPTDGNATTLSEALERAPSATVAASSPTPSIWTKESQAVAPSIPPRGPLQKPPIISEDGAPRREIDFVFLNFGRQSPSPIAAVPFDSLLAGLTYRRRPGVFLPPPPSTFITAASPVLSRLSKLLAVKLSPLALSSVSTPTISGDETTADGFARMSSAFLILGASTEEPPFTADTDGKLAGCMLNLF